MPASKPLRTVPQLTVRAQYSPQKFERRRTPSSRAVQPPPRAVHPKGASPRAPGGTRAQRGSARPSARLPGVGARHVHARQRADAVVAPGHQVGEHAAPGQRLEGALAVRIHGVVDVEVAHPIRAAHHHDVAPASDHRDVPEDHVAVHQHPPQHEGIHGPSHARPRHLRVPVQRLYEEGARRGGVIPAPVLVLAADVWSRGIVEFADDLALQAPAVGSVPLGVRIPVWEVVPGDHRNGGGPAPVRLVLHAGLYLAPHVARATAGTPGSVVVVEVAPGALPILHLALVLPPQLAGVARHEEVLRRLGGAVVLEVAQRPVRHGHREAEVPAPVLDVAA
mmetsp:Transcript_100634/g.267486  ORF Transcript_100634/g.267486 Transcript_100634/m.267486 type:complete len:336 (-) Transcript_100634:217-1224(-)